MQGGCMFFLKLLGKLVKILESETSPNQIAWGFALGMIPGLTPFWSAHNFLVFLLILILRVNIPSAILGMAIYSLFAWALDPLFHTIGFAMLTDISFLQPMWTTLYNAPLAPFTRFNNTVVMGSLVCAIVLLIPNALLFRLMVKRYRASWGARVRQWRIVQALKGSKVVGLYQKIKRWGD